MGIKASSQRNKSHLPMAKGGMFIEQMELCEGEDAKTTFYDVCLFVLFLKSVNI